MLVPIVWFEESAMIPEESAQKFRSLYIERVRLVNWSLISLLIASIVLLIVDARLLVSTHYWRQFKIVNFQSAAAPPSPDVAQSSQQPEVANNKSALSVLARKLSGRQLTRNQLTVNEKTSTRPLAPRPRGANSPLLSHASSSSSSSTSSSYTTASSNSTTPEGAHSSSSSSSSSSASSTPAGSPELRKWAGPTRVHLNGGASPPARDGGATPETFRHESSGVVGGEGGGVGGSPATGNKR